MPSLLFLHFPCRALLGQLVFFSKAKSVHLRSAPSPSPSITNGGDGRTLSPSTTLSDALQMLSVLATDQTPVYTKRNDAMSFMDAFIPRVHPFHQSKIIEIDQMHLV